MQKNDGVTFFPFSRDIPWQTSNKIIKPDIPVEMWNKHIKNNPINILCPGYLLEAIISSYAEDILASKRMRVSNWIIPSYYAKALLLFGVDINVPEDGKNPVVEYHRLLEARNGYPSPVFFDKRDNVYFNMLFCYGKYMATYNRTKGNNIKPFYKQIINNLCMGNNIRLNLNKFDYQKGYDLAYDFLYRYGVDKDDKYFIIDCSNIFLMTHDKRASYSFSMFPEQVREIVYLLKMNNIKAIIMSEDFPLYKRCGLDNVVNDWANLDSDVAVSLVVNSYGLLSPNYQMYMLAAMFGVPNIINTDIRRTGWKFSDVAEFNKDYMSKNWLYTTKKDGVAELYHLISGVK